MRPDLLRPLAHGAGRPYPERADVEAPWHDKLAQSLYARAVAPIQRVLVDPARRIERVVAAALRHERELSAATDQELAAQGAVLRWRLRREGFHLPIVGLGFALVREVATRVIGRRHYDPQLMAGWALLQGRLVEMETGEGKTLAATLPAVLAALAGEPVHVVTVNDYLAERDAVAMAPIYRFLGLSCAAVLQGMDAGARRAAYAASITYCSNKELAFDYLRDRAGGAREGQGSLRSALAGLGEAAVNDERLVLRGLHFAIVDEADSVLIDEARTPLILSSPPDLSRDRDDDRCRRALELAGRLTADDYVIERRETGVQLGEAGRAKLEAWVAGAEAPWRSARQREELVAQALTAMHLFRREQHYVVLAGKVQIVDELTGRVMPDRAWQHGLQQMIEAKEGCAPTEPRQTVARITYQRLFRRYLRLAGMTGTAREVAAEIKAVYDLDLVPIPRLRPLRRSEHPARVFASADARWHAVADAVERTLRDEKRPVLIGTRTVRASETLSAILRQRGVEHALLNAKQDRGEAELIARAGEKGQVTVATNMAGRGTDIRLGDGVAQRGGLHVILTECHESRRIDRQLIGRAARQGDPGSWQALVALDDDLFRLCLPRVTRLLVFLARRRALGHAAFLALRGVAQAAAERRHAEARIGNIKRDKRLARSLAFSGSGE